MFNIFGNCLGLIICPSRELAKQTFDIINHYITYLERANYPRLRSCLAIGGVPVFESLDIIKRYFLNKFTLIYVLNVLK